MIDYIIYYDRATRSWYGFWCDAEGNQLHEAFFACDKNGVLLSLGAARDQMMQLAREASQGENHV